MEDQDRDHISSRSHFSGRSEQELDEMLDELRAGKIGINQPGQNSSEHDSEDTPEENDNASGTGNAAKSKKGKSRKEGFNLKDEVISRIQVLVAAAIIAFCVNHFIIANSEVPTSSMETTIMAGDRVIGSRLSYKFGAPQRGDIAIFIYPDDEAKGIKTYYVKRIIGMPGDTITYQNDKLTVNGKEVKEEYLKEFHAAFAKDKLQKEYAYSDYFQQLAKESKAFTVNADKNTTFSVTVPEGKYFLLGDNRIVSKDSREVGYFDKSALVGEVKFRFWPLDKIGTVEDN